MTKIETEDQLQAVANGNRPAVVCFHSPRSAYSRRTVKLLEKLQHDFQTSDFWLLDADLDGFLPTLLGLGVVGLPTILVFRPGEGTDRLVGERSEKTLKALLADRLV